MKHIQILIGSEMGTAEMVAEAIKETLAEVDYIVMLNTYAKACDVTNSPEDILLICTSNTGAGDLPGNIQPFYLQLLQDFPAIAGRQYGVINLGDSSYTTFGEAGRNIDAAMADIGAVRIGEPLVLDACSGIDPIQAANTWVHEWVKLF